MTNLQPVPEQRSQTPLDFYKFHRIPQKGQTPEKVWTPGQERIQTQNKKRKRS